MSNKFLRIALLGAAAAALIACTRDRETPTPTPAAGTPVAGQSVTVTNTQSSGGEPVVETTGGTAAGTPSPQPTEAETPTPEPTAAQTFDYTVKPGETLASIADKFQTEVQTLRELNFLLDDNIFAGQMLAIPWSEGITAEGAPTASPTPFSYVVEQGDTLSSIALQFGVQPGVLIEVNNIMDPNNLAVGTPLLIPGYTSAAPAAGSGESAGSDTGDTAGGDTAGTAAGAAGSYVTHVVQPGESLGQIAAEYGVDPVALADANNITNGNLIRVGQQLVIPGVTERDALEARGERHIVQSGESLSMIAAQYGVTVEAILAANSLDDPNTIVVGQELLIPPAD